MKYEFIEICANRKHEIEADSLETALAMFGVDEVIYSGERFSSGITRDTYEVYESGCSAMCCRVHKKDDSIGFFHFCLRTALSYDEPEPFIYDIAKERSLFSEEAGTVPEEWDKWLTQVWMAAHRSFRDIYKMSGLTQRGISEYFGIPLRTVENWSAFVNASPFYTLIMMQELLGLVDRKMPLSHGDDRDQMKGEKDE